MTEDHAPPDDTSSTAAEAPPGPASRAHRWIVPGLLGLGTVLAVVSIFAVWANRQLLNADNWSDTSSALLAEPAVQSQLSAFLVDQLYANVDVAAEVRNAVPPRMAPLAGPAANGLRTLAERTTTGALSRPRIQEAWRVANKTTAEQLIRVIKGESQVARISGNAVVLDLRPIVLELAARLGLPNALVAKMPPTAGTIRVMSSDQLSSLQDAASLLGSLATILPIVALLCFGLAVLLASDRRRHTLLWAGVDLIAAGVVVLVLRRLAGHHVVNSLAATESVKPAAEAVWSTGTRMLRDVAQATIIAAIPLVLAALIAGPSRLATSLRRAAAPWLRDRPAVLYGAEVVLVGIIVAWGPIPATRKLLPLLVMIGLLVFGVEVLRRQVAQEFPEVTAADARAAIAARARLARAAFGKPAPASLSPEADAVAPRTPDNLDRLERLVELHDRGVLTDGEFNAQKAALLSP